MSGIVLPQIFQDHMVLQQKKAVPVWGTASADTKISVSIQGGIWEAVSDADGNFCVMIGPLCTSVQETLSVTDGSDTAVVNDIAIGEVWIAGGQSNMEFWMRYEKHLEDVRPVCADPLVRYFEVPKLSFDGQEEDFDFSLQGHWRRADAENIEFFSGVAYFFAAALRRAYDVPVGVVGCCYGGTTTAAWMPKASVEAIGQPWIRDYKAAVLGVDLKAYWEEQHKNPANATGRPFENAYNEKFLKTTPSLEEAMAFLAEMYGACRAADGETAGPTALPPIAPTAFPGALYEHMLKRIAGYGARGFLWYQGESDEPHAGIHGIMLARLIEDWRALWREELPFLTVQLPGYESGFGVVQNGWKELRCQQQAVADAMPGVFMTSVSDAGERNDIHPKDKQKPGERLALLARGVVYGEDVLCRPPRAVSITRNGKEIRIHFEYADGGLCFEVPGPLPPCGDERFPLRISGAAAKSCSIEGEDLVVRLYEEPGEPARFCFAEGLFFRVGLCNAAGLPVLPFELQVQ